MKFRLLTISTLLSALVYSTDSGAHHSNAPHFDNTKEISLTGVVTKWAFVNPHAYIYLDVAEAGGETHNWRCEGSSATSLGRNGYSPKTFVPGQEITVVGNPARREDYDCALTSIVFADGTVVSRNEALPENKRVGELPIVVGSSESRADYLDNGQPNISGYWLRAGRGGPPSARVGLGRGPAGARAGGAPAAGGRPGARGPGGPPRGPQIGLTAAGQAVQDAYEQIYDDPAIHCDIGNIFFGWTHDGHVNEIKQYDDRIVMQYGYMDFVRTIYLNMEEHPDDLVPSRGGHSIGHWEGDALVVDTVGFTQGILFPLTGIPNSDQMHATERFWYDKDSMTLNSSYTAVDPVFLNEPYTGRATLAISAVPYEPYNCTELSGDNNRRPEERGSR